MIGQFKHRLGIYVPETVPDVMGGQAVGWVFYAKCWAGIKTLSPRRRSEDGRDVVMGVYKITTRYRTNFPVKARLLWGDRTLKIITASDPDGRRERLHLICDEERS